MEMTRREFLKSGIIAVFLLLLKPWKLVQSFVPKVFLYAQTGKELYPGKEKIFIRETILQPSSYAG